MQPSMCPQAAHEGTATINVVGAPGAGDRRRSRTGFGPSRTCTLATSCCSTTRWVCVKAHQCHASFPHSAHALLPPLRAQLT
eukprot:706095-Rhodomonas_salina.1